MLQSLNKINRFANSQSLYPILLSTILALAFYIGRVVYGRIWWHYSNLVWNLFLAWIPYLLSMLAAAIYRDVALAMLGGGRIPHLG